MTTPPPQGQNPFAQGQNPYGQQPQGGNPYGQPTAPQGVPQQPSPYFNQGGAPVPPPAPRGGGLKKVLRFGLPIAGLLVAGIAYLVVGGDDAEKLAVGDCLRNKGTDSNASVEKLDCSDSKATHTVLKKADGSTLASLACTSVQDKTTATLTWQEGSDSFVLCLGDNK
ncbi:hypothetical protein G6045_09525 [Streptomyces sp. YC504]|uniref:Uncharacterized protein n=1 Tax=Streptomyces mesophilus TaxID=1775132 RepID=A0A6G4XGD5_9ACTN|nr:hypothetical protein [Streptomyces mesophilus]NGO75910.1 hypothetical protein [Streptomyces mesophilus]